MTTDIPIDFVTSLGIEAAHERLRKRFEPHIIATSALPVVHVLAGLTLRLARLSKATRLMNENGLKEESQAQFRSSSEAIVNLLYILDVGPKLGDKDSTSLAQQFMAYGDVAYHKMLNRRSKVARRAFKRVRKYSDAQFDQFLIEAKQKRDDAKTLHGCGDSRWHHLDLVAMAAKVRENAPAYVDQNFAEMTLSSFVSANSATHGDALSLRSQYNELGNAPLELIWSENSSYADGAAQHSLWAWKCMGSYYNEGSFVDNVFNEVLSAELKKRHEESKKKSSRTILLP